MLNLDNASAKVVELPGGEGSGNCLFERDDGQAGKGKVLIGFLLQMPQFNCAIRFEGTTGADCGSQTKAADQV